MKLFTASEKRTLGFLAALFILGLLVQQVRRHISPPIPAAAWAAREQTLKTFQEGHQRYLATARTYPEPLPGVSPGEPLDINHADEEELQVLPGVGPVTAKKIVDYRLKNGYFQTLQDLAGVSGIGPRSLERWADLVTFQLDPADQPEAAPDR